MNLSAILVFLKHGTIYIYHIILSVVNNMEVSALSYSTSTG